MSLTEYLSVPFLISLGITLLLVGIVGMFFTQRLQEQNHKINSMVGLVSTMAEELNYVRAKLMQIGGFPEPQKPNSSFYQEGGLIEVSDGEDDSDEDDEDESSDDEDDSESDDDKEEYEIEVSEEKNNNDNIKVINIHDSFPGGSEEPIDCEIEDIDESESVNSDTESSYSESTNLVEMDSATDLETLNISLSNIDGKKLNVDMSVIDYKKLSLNKLRSIVSEKGLTDDVNKLKKNELLKLLGQ
jgi:hypothetical protein